ncbi:MAG TPA: sigma 54-interacting transcriptional regulator [Methylomirabilota bacterium]|jgi:DNA-binding NtrC family response regulator/tetratricopeptide (TPR) repeat protein|nr:sigma 54-interacting transcriptional regulator [Methylomirabilota bacterium]
MPPAFAEIIGESAAIVALRRRLEQIVQRYGGARRLPPLLLLGETGTGKSMIARALHQAGPRARQPFVDVNCAAIPATLMEAEMFGFERGAFTDARHAKPGLFAAADRGTIFLDEIGLLPDGLQPKLLKVVEERQLRPLGATVSRPTDVWIIAATSEDLEAGLRKHRFREDLYHRLAVVTLHVPPLRQRGRDVVVLAEHFLRRACTDYDLPTKTFTPKALARLTSHRWPGNIRELGNVIERVALLSEASAVDAEALGLSAPPQGDAVDDPPIEARTAIDDAVDGVERDHLKQALASAGGNVTHAARRLGLTRNTLRYRLRKHGLAAARGVMTAPTPAPPTAPAPARWERRRVVFLRVALVPANNQSEHAPRAVLEDIQHKIAAFGGALDGVSRLGLTAVFGLDSVEDASRRAAHAAAAIRQFAARTREADPATPIPALAIHGMHALLWRVGDAVHVDMDARTEAWQALDRLVARAGDGNIIVSEPATPSLRGDFHLAPAPDTDDGARLLVDGERTVTRRARGPFVGRRDEMAILHGRLELAHAGGGQVVGISGEPGIGKSRLLFEFHRALDGEKVGYLSARALSYGREMPLLPVVELVRRAHDIDDADGVDVVRGKLHSRLTSLGLPADDTAPYLLRLLDITAGTESIRHLSPDAMHQRTLEVFQRVVVASSQAQPLVVAIEDLHWMDRASEGYVSVLVEALVDAPILLVTTYRSGTRPGWSERSHVSELRLQPLARSDAQRVLDGVVERNRPLPTATSEAILDRAEGNPFFIEELARAVGPGAAPVPESVEAVLLARIDRLPADTKSVLQAASVLGRDVSVRLLEALIPERASSKEHLRELQRLECLHDRSGGAHELYRFKHALTQEVAYSSMLPDDRRVLHARAVGAIEAQYADRLAEHTQTLAHHAVAGKLWDKAIDYLRHTGAKAFARSAHYEAIACLEQALKIVGQFREDRTTDAIELRIDLFTPLLILAEYQRALDCVTEAARIAERVDDRRRLGRALAHQCLILRVMGMTEAAIEPGRRALAIATQFGDTQLATSANFALGTAYTSRGEWAEAEACYRAAITPFEGDVTAEIVQTLHYQESGARAWLAWALESRGECEEALELARTALRIALVRGSKAQEATYDCMLGIVLLGMGDASEAIRVLERAVEISHAYDVRDWMGIASMLVGRAYALGGRVAEAIRSLEAGAAHCEVINQMTNFPARLATLAEAYALAGRRDDADRTAHRAAALAREHGHRADEALCLQVLGRIAAAGDGRDVATAEKYFRDARDLAAALGMRPLVAHCHLDLARLYRRTRRTHDADAHFTRATTLYREMGMRIWLEKAEAELAAVGPSPLTC